MGAICVVFPGMNVWTKIVTAHFYYLLLCLEYPVLSLVSTLFNMTPVLFSVDAGVDTEQRWIFLKNIIISLI